MKLYNGKTLPRHSVGNRTGRVEPRALKRRPKPYDLLNKKNGVHGRPRGSWDVDDLYEGESARRTMEKPLPIIVELWNSRGHDQTMPAADKLLKLRVSYSSEKISRQGYLVPSGEWSPVPARGAVSWKELPARFLASLTINKSRPAVFAPLAKALDHADPVVRRQAVTSIRRAKRSFQA